MNIVKLSILTTILVGIINTAFGQEPFTFTLQGQIGNYSSPTKLIVVYKNNNHTIQDTIAINDGKFNYRNTISNSTPAKLFLVNVTKNFDLSKESVSQRDFIINPETIIIKGNSLEKATIKYKHSSNIVINNSVASENFTTILDTTQVVTKESKNISLNIGVDDSEKTVKYPRTFGGLTFSRIDWGFSRLMDHGSFNLSEDNSFLSYKKASNFGFDIAQFGVRFNDRFKTYLSAGFEWNYLRLKQNILLDQNSQYLNYETIDKNVADYKKNILTSTYLRLPLTFEWRSAQNHNGDRLKVAFGAMTGILLKGTQRLKSDADGKQKFKNNFNLASFQYGPFVRVGFDNFGIFGKYYVNDMFEKSPEQKGLNNFTFGLTLGF